MYVIKYLIVNINLYQKRKSKYIRRYRKSNKRYNNYQNKARTFNKLSKT